jgi:hypothetical protein
MLYVELEGLKRLTFPYHESDLNYVPVELHWCNTFNIGPFIETCERCSVRIPLTSNGLCVYYLIVLTIN